MIRAGLVAAALPSADAQAAPGWETEYGVALVSDYRWRGVSLSDEDPSLQVDGTLSHESGFWLWGGVNTVSPDLGSAEINLAAGYTRELGGIEWTGAVTRYLYPGERDIDYTELSVIAARGFGPVSLSAGVEYVPEQDNYSENDVYTWLGWEIAGPHAISFHGHVGRDDGVMAPIEDAVDFSVGAGVPIGVFALDLTYVEVETVSPAWVLSLAYRP